MHVLLHDDLGRLTLRRLQPWHRVLAGSRAARMDRELADGMSPEASPTLAARAIRLTSTDFRRDLAASLHRILSAAEEPSAVMRSQAGAARSPCADGAATLGRTDTGYPANAGGRRASTTRRRPSPRIPLCHERVSQSAPLLAALASRLVEPGPVPVRGVALVSRLLADGTGPLYREACRDHLDAMLERATHGLTR